MFRKYTLLARLLILFTLPVSVSGNAAELVMVESQGCVFCEKFNAEIAPGYSKTTEGKIAPLRRIDIANPWPADLAGVKEETLTPTFILVDKGREIDRLVGYPGDEYFWFLLGELLAKLPQQDD